MYSFLSFATPDRLPFTGMTGKTQIAPANPPQAHAAGLFCYN